MSCKGGSRWYKSNLCCALLRKRCVWSDCLALKHKTKKKSLLADPKPIRELLQVAFFPNLDQNTGVWISFCKCLKPVQEPNCNSEQLCTQPYGRLRDWLVLETRNWNYWFIICSAAFVGKTIWVVFSTTQKNCLFMKNGKDELISLY